MAKKNTENSSEAIAPSNSIRCRYCGQKNQVREGYENNQAVCGRCRLPLSDEPHKKFADLNKHDYIHPADSKAATGRKPCVTAHPSAAGSGGFDGESGLGGGA